MAPEDGNRTDALPPEIYPQPKRLQTRFQSEGRAMAASDVNVGELIRA